MEIVNNEINVCFADTFHVMNENELSNVYLNNSWHRWGIWDYDNHIIITIIWEKKNPLLIKLADVSAMVKRNEKLTRKGYPKSSNYELIEFFDYEIDHIKAKGYRFKVLVENSEQYVENLLLKYKNTIYCFTVIGRTNNIKYNQETFKKFLNEIKFN